MERETKEIKVGEHKVVLKTYLTVRENREIRDILLKNVKLGVDDGEAKIDTIPPEIISQIEDKTIEMVIFSFDDDKEKILDKVLELRSGEFTELMTEVNKVSGGLTEKKTN